jgi:hypothetical protein
LKPGLSVSEIRGEAAAHQCYPGFRHRAATRAVDPCKRGGEAIGVALAALLAVGNDVKPGAFLIADGQQRGIILRRFQPLRIDQPEIVRAYPRHHFSEPRAIDQPFGLRVRADQGRRKQTYFDFS